MEPDEVKKKGKKNKVIKELDKDKIYQIFQAQQEKQLMTLVTENVKNLDYKMKKELSEIVDTVMKEKYEKEDQNMYELIIKDFNKINHVLKFLQINTPICDIFITRFIELFKKQIEEIGCKKEDIFVLWQNLPFRNLQQFLNQLNLYEDFKSIKEDKLYSILKDLLLEQKLQQCCSYYLIYNKEITEFEKDHLVPKLVNSDQIFSPLVIKLFKERPHVKDQVIEVIDKAKAVVILQQLGEDPRLYQNINKFILRKHYLSMLNQYKQWFIFQDKMSFNPQFILQYCKNQTSIEEKIRKSILVRNGLTDGNEEQQIKNPLFQKDLFSCAQKILTEEQIDKNYILLKDYDVNEQDVFFVDDTQSQIFQKMKKDLLSSENIGFDAQNRCTSTKYEQQGVSLLQFSIQKTVYIVDYLKLQKNPIFIEFFTQLLSRNDLKKIGHTVQSDIRYLQKTMKMENVHGFVDIVKIFKEKYPNEMQNSLAFMSEKLIGKKISKYEQRSNWNRRPLKKTQLHYAALDAKICLQLYEILNTGVKITFNVANKKKQKKQVIVRMENIVYDRNYEKLLTSKTPKFLVDNMLKKLSSTMRNLGIDTEYVSVCDHKLTMEMAEKQQRIILTRDNKLLKKRDHKVPVYCISEKGDSDEMFEEVKDYFKLDLEEFKPLSRCVKCNGDEIEVIQKEQALKTLVFKYEDTVNQFWRCRKCRQIYWEGKQFEKALNKFTNMKN